MADEEGHQKSQKTPQVLESEELLELPSCLFLEDLQVNGLKTIFYQVKSEVDTWSSISCICPEIRM